MNDSQPTTGTTTITRHTTVLSCVAGVGGGIGTAEMPILTVCTTTHPVPQIELGLGGTIGMVMVIP